MTVTNLYCVNRPYFLRVSFQTIFRIMRKPLRGIGRAMLFCMGFHWIKVKGRLSSPEEAPILAVAPHSSFIDALALAVICISSPISRKENESIPLVGGLFVSTLQKLATSLRHQKCFLLSQTIKWIFKLCFQSLYCTHRF